jgi:hypothetical protein
MKEPSVEALVEEAKLWTNDALVRDTLDILAQRIAELEAKLAEAEAALATAHVAGIYKQQRDRYRSAHAGLEAKVEMLTRERDEALRLGSAIYGNQQWERAEAAEARLAEALTVALEYRAITDRLLRSLRGET